MRAGTKTPVNSLIIFLFSIIIGGCQKKGKDVLVNHAPVANAGADITVFITSCYSSRTAELDGSRSYDPDNSLLNFFWHKLSGPSCILSDTMSQKAHASQLVAGQYVFELKVIDEGGAFSKGLSSKDTVIINVTGSTTPPEFDVDALFNSTASFTNNAKECYSYFDVFLNSNVNYCYYYDYIITSGAFNLAGLGQINVSVNEYADTTIGGNYHLTSIGLSCISCTPSRYLNGTCSINFKRLWEQGGGAFSGTVKMENGSAKSNCDPQVFDNAIPLTISGNVDTTAHAVSITLKGKVYL